MSHNEREAWNRRYSQGCRSSRPPDALLVEAYDRFISPTFPQGGTALDLAGGAGRHSFYLAERKWQVTLVDVSEIGIEQARSEARRRGLEIQFVCQDTRDVELGDERFDLVIVFLYLDRGTLPKIRQALRPGGIVVYMTYTEEHEKFASRGNAHPMYFLRERELLDAFTGFEVLHHSENGREPGLAELVARKPL